MKKINHRGVIAVAAAVLGTGAISLAQPANAQSTSRQDAVKDVRNAEIALQKERADLRYARTPAERADALKDIRNAEEHLRTEQADAARFGSLNYDRFNNFPGRGPITFGHNDGFDNGRFDNDRDHRDHDRFDRNDRDHGRRW